MNKKHRNKKVTKCLLCSYKKLKKIFYLGNFFVSNFVKKKNIKIGNVKAPLNLFSYTIISYSTTRNNV